MEGTCAKRVNISRTTLRLVRVDHELAVDDVVAQGRHASHPHAALP